MNHKLYLLSCALLIAFGASAQKNKNDSPDKNIDRYLNNGKAKNCYNMILFRVVPAFSGYVGLSYERKLTRVFSLEGGLYTKIGSKGICEIDRIKDYEYDFSRYVQKFNGGIGLMIYPKINIGRRSLNDVISFGIRAVRQYSSLDLRYPDPTFNSTYKTQLQHSNYFFLVGNHRNIFSNFTLGMDVGAGIYIDKYRQIKTYNDITNQVTTEEKRYGNSTLYVDMSLGYLF